MITKKSKIFLAGHNGMVGSAIYNKLKKILPKNVVPAYDGLSINF